jgi:hypothetical protein
MFRILSGAVLYMVFRTVVDVLLVYAYRTVAMHAPNGLVRCADNLRNFDTDPPPFPAAIHHVLLFLLALNHQVVWQGGLPVYRLLPLRMQL